ncbi:amino acid adenylation domain-containing protein [Streptomyces sp. NPDC096132]|uniref:amino acid adenylation domain-containing protein n=1 Tax=Streptomyces sp. NPDC096132 TaxID=3366075 RepID=UPI0037F217C5
MTIDRAELLRQRLARQHGVSLPPRPTEALHGPATDPQDQEEQAHPDDLKGCADLLEALAFVVTAHPDSPAVSHEGQVMSYRQLDEASSELAAAVRAAHGVPGRPVAILLERSAEMIVAAVAVLKAGACYVPLDPAAPPARVALILQDAEPALVITSRGLAERLPEHTPLLCIDEPREPVPTEDVTAVDPSAPAYVLYTSGTTGGPKGVQVSHRNLLQLHASTSTVFGLTSDDVWSMCHSFAFDFSVWEIWGALLRGACVSIVPQHVAQDPVALRRHLRDERVTVMNHTPKAFNELIAEDRRHTDRLPLRRIMLGGEALHFADLKPWVAKYGDHSPRLFNIYGMTEATVLSSYRRVLRADLELSTSPIGQPLPELAFRLVDEFVRPVPAGTIGEIVITGNGVGVGYLKRPELTADRFIELTGPDGRPERGYRTGDMAVLSASGEYEFRGRVDDQVKIRGFRVELAEVEDALGALPGVDTAAVLARDLPGPGMTLVAYVVATTADAASPAVLRSALRETLPDYMLPGAYVFLDGLPLTRNGKLDRRALPQPRLGHGPLDEQADGDSTTRDSDSVEAEITGIVAALLKADHVAPGADFFELGGHSLLATRVLSRVYTRFGVRIELREFFQSPTVRALAGLVREERRRASRGGALRGRGPADGIGRITADGPAPATDAQRRLYFLSQLDPDSAAYNLHTALSLEGSLSVTALERSFASILARHTPLRTVFRLADGELVQEVQPPPARFRLVPEDVTATEDDNHGRQDVERWSEKEAARPFDLERDLLLRVRLLRTGPQSHVLLVTLHHAACDGWSVGVLSRELTCLYRHFVQYPDAEDVPLPDLPRNYADYAHAMRAWLDGPSAEEEIGYWTTRLADLPDVHRLPLDKPRPARMTSNGRTIVFTARGKRAKALREFCRRHNVTPYMLLQTVFAAQLARRSGSPDVVLGTAVANRPTAELDDLIGMFVNSLAIRVPIAEDDTFRTLLAGVRERALRDLEHRHVPFEVLVKRLNPRRATDRAPLFQIMLVVQNNEPTEPELDGVEVTRLRLTDRVAQFDLLLEATEGDGGDFLFRWEYNTDLFHHSTMTAMATEFEQLLQEAVTDPDALAVPRLVELARGGDAAGRTTAGRPGTLSVPSPLFPLRQNDTAAGHPVFAVPGVLGFGSAYVQLSAHFSDRSFYALHTRDLVRADGALSVERLAGDCADAVVGAAGGRAVHLVGHSMGACLAFATAEVLGRRGQDVVSLVLLDPPRPDAVAEALGASRAHRLRNFLGSLAHLFPADTREIGLRLLEPGVLAEEEILREAQRLIGPEAGDVLDGGLESAFRTYLRMSSLVWSEPRPQGRPALLIRAGADPHPLVTGPSSGWESCLTGSLERHEVPATHEGMLRHPHAEQVAALMTRFFAANEARNPRERTNAR